MPGNKELGNKANLKSGAANENGPGAAATRAVVAEVPRDAQRSGHRHPGKGAINTAFTVSRGPYVLRGHHEGADGQGSHRQLELHGVSVGWMGCSIAFNGPLLQACADDKHDVISGQVIFITAPLQTWGATWCAACLHFLRFSGATPVCDCSHSA